MFKKEFTKFGKYRDFSLRYAHVDAPEISINIEITLYMFPHVLRKE